MNAAVTAAGAAEGWIWVTVDVVQAAAVTTRLAREYLRTFDAPW
jgi:hypothetical protein